MSEQTNVRELQSQYQYAKECLATLEEQLSYAFQSSFGISFKKSYKLYIDYKIKDAIDKFDNIDSYLESLSDEFIEEWTEKLSPDFSQVFNLSEDEPEYASNHRLFINDVLKELYKEIPDIEDFNQTMSEVEAMVKEANEEYFKYINSDEYINKKQKEIDELRAKLDTLEGLEKTKCEQMIDITERCIHGSIILYRIEPTEGFINYDELKSITRAYFNPNASANIMQKYKSKCKALELDPSSYKSFCDIEEIVSNTTGEDLYCYNNLILFVWLRMVAYADPSSEVDNFVISEFIKFMIKIVHNKFPSEENRQTTLNVVKRFCKIFDDAGFRDKFEEYNKLSPKHYARRKIDDERKVNYKNDYNLLVAEWNEKFADESNKLEEMTQNDIDTLDIRQVYAKLCDLQKQIDDKKNIDIVKAQD